MSIKTYHQFLAETSLSRVWEHFTQTDYEAGILSAERGQYRDQPKVNARRTTDLAGRVRAAGFGYIFLDGHYVEVGFGPVEETSIAVFGGTNGKLKGYLRQWREEYDQDAVVYKPEDSTHIYALTASGEDDIGAFHPNRIGAMYSSLRGRPGTFMFESALGTLNFFGRLARSHGLL